MMIYSGHSGVVAIMRMLRWQWGLIVLAILFLLFWDPLNNWLNYDEVEVVVTAVNIGCSVAPAGSDEVVGDRLCDQVRAEFKPSPGSTINRRTQFSFDYLSPADGQMHKGSIVRVAEDDGPFLAVGDRVTIQASKRAALRVRDIPR
jgi:hypothetical protein